MATVNLGRIKFVWQGAYSGATAYVADDVVSYNGSSYICILASTGNLPTNTTYWSIMSSAGTNGTNGTDVGTTITTQGDILYRNASGLARLGAGTSGQVLTTAGAGANPSWSTVSSDYVLRATTDASSSASVSFDGYFSATYKNYKVIISTALPASDAQTFRMRYRVSNAEVTDSYYVSSIDTSYVNSSSQANDYDGVWNTSSFRLNGSSWSNSDALGNLNAEITIYNPLQTSYKKGFTCIIMSNQGSGHFNSTSSGSYTNSNAALSGVTFFNASGNIATGNFKLYGIK